MLTKWTVSAASTGNGSTFTINSSTWDSLPNLSITFLNRWNNGVVNNGNDNEKHTIRAVDCWQKCLVWIHASGTIVRPFQSLTAAQNANCTRMLCFWPLDVGLLLLSTSPECVVPSKACERWILQIEPNNNRCLSYLKKWKFSLVVPLKLQHDWMQQWRFCVNALEVSIAANFPRYSISTNYHKFIYSSIAILFMDCSKLGCLKCQQKFRLKIDRWKHLVGLEWMRSSFNKRNFQQFEFDGGPSIFGNYLKAANVGSIFTNFGLTELFY